jgi:hypothetical protein
LINFQRKRETPTGDSQSAEAKVWQEMALVAYQSLPMLDNGSRQVDDDAFKPMVRTSVEPHVAAFSGTIAFQSIKCMFSYISYSNRNMK